MGINTTVPTVSSGAVYPAATYNTYLAGLLNGAQATWDTYTPGWSATGTAPALGNGTLVGAYLQLGKTVLFTIKWTAGSTTTYGTGQYRFNLPFTVGSADHIATGFIGDSSVGAAGYTAAVIGLIAAGTITVAPYAGNVGAAQAVSNTTPQTFANGDRIWLSGTYQAA